jgi:hypothetical protein
MANNGKSRCRECGAVADYSVHEPSADTVVRWVWNSYCDAHVPPEDASATATSSSFVK